MDNGEIGNQINNYVSAGGFGVMGTVIAIWIRKFMSKVGVDVARDKAELSIMANLQDQVAEMQARLIQTEEENTRLSIDLAKVQAKLTEYEAYKTVSETLSAKVEEKDAKYERYLIDSTELISNLKSKLLEKDFKISSLAQESGALRNRVDHLEQLFSKPECHVCLMKVSNP